MKKYLRLACTSCKRTVDKIVDNLRVIPDKCTITLNCQGRLLPVEYRSNAEIAVAPSTGTTDWYPRNETPVASIATSEPSFVNTSTGYTNQLVLAVELAAAPAPSATAQLTLNVRADTPKNYRQFTYRYDVGFTTVAGVETAVEKKTLRFTAYGSNPDLVEVYVNGVKQEQGLGATQYQIYDGANSIAPNSIMFNAPVIVTSTTQVDVIVSKVQALAQNFLSFFKNVDNPARTTTGSWENVDSFTRLVGGSWKTFYIFTYDVLNNPDIALNTILVPTGDVMVSGSIAVPLTSCYFMLAREPYSTIDRYPDISIRLDGLTTDRDYLKYHAVEKVAQLQATQTAIEAFYPPARLTKFDPEPTIKTSLAGETEQLVIDGKVIVGPDA